MARKDPTALDYKDIAAIMAKTEGLNKDVTEFVVLKFIEFTKARLLEWKGVHWPGVGLFYITNLNAEVQKKKNPRTGEEYYWKNRPNVGFRASRKIKDKLNGKEYAE